MHAGIIEPGHFRFHASGETIARLEERLGYVHKGVDALMAGADLARGAQLAGRVSGDSTVAYQIAFARAAERALGVAVPRRAVWLRALMAELERLANHLGDIGAICNDASFALMHAHCAILRERVLRATKRALGHRLMMDAIAPGGVAVDLNAAGRQALRDLTALIRDRFPRLVELYDNTASLQDRTVRTGVLDRELAQRFGCGGVIGRASGTAFDARRDHPYPPYDELRFDVPARQEGDVNARVWVRIREVEESLRLITPNSRSPAERPGSRRDRAERRVGRGLCAGRGISRRHFRQPAPRSGRPGRALPPARSLVVPVAAAGGGDRRQHRRGFSDLQQVVQLLLFRARSVRGGETMRRVLLEGLIHRPLTENAPDASDPELVALAAGGR